MTDTQRISDVFPWYCFVEPFVAPTEVGGKWASIPLTYAYETGSVDGLFPPRGHNLSRPPPAAHPQASSLGATQRDKG